MARAGQRLRRAHGLVLLLAMLTPLLAGEGRRGSAARADGRAASLRGGRRAPAPDDSYYAALGVGRTASEDALKRAYRALALRHHPDKGGDPEAFKRVSEAFGVLSDPAKRRLYDAHGKEGVERAAAGGGVAPGGVSAEELFGMFFGGGGGGGGGWGDTAGPATADDTVAALDLSLEELFAGAAKPLALRRRRVCAACGGGGARRNGTRAARCGTCEGQGVVIAERALGGGLVQRVRATCPDCDGDGARLASADRCAGCAGRKTVEETVALSATVAPGSAQGERIVLAGEGNAAPGLAAGDLVLVVRERPHRRFERRGADLVCALRLSLAEALCGFERPIERLDGTALRLRVARGRTTAPGALKRVRGEGMPVRGAGGARGDLFVQVRVDLPDAIDEARLGALERLLAELAPPGPAEAAGAAAASAEGADSAELEDVDLRAGG
jgi:DnaJ family protein A protein 2